MSSGIIASESTPEVPNEKNSQSQSSRKLPPSKKRRMNKAAKKANAAPAPVAENMLAKLPLELLAEVLMYTCSPKDVLAVAYTSKFFCHTLVGSSAIYVWKYVRQNCKPKPLPDPHPMFTEPGYAAFVFDGSSCDVCGATTTNAFMSYSMKTRVCKKESCLKEAGKTLCRPPLSTDLHRKLTEWIPVLEKNSKIVVTTPMLAEGTYYHGNTIACRKEDWEKAFTEHLAGTQAPDTTDESRATYNEKRERDASRMSKFMKFCNELIQWKQAYETEYKEVKKHNMTFTHQLAADEGWDFVRLSNSATYCAFQSNQNVILERIRPIDYQFVSEKVREEQLKAKEKSERRNMEERGKLVRQIIAEYHEYLKTSGLHHPLPTLSVFRKLPVIQQVQSAPVFPLKKEKKEKGKTKPNTSSKNTPQNTPDRETILAARSMLKSGWVSEVLKVQIEECRKDAMNALGATLGYPEWKTASSKHLHPVERVTARFRCKRCDTYGHKHREDECMDFAGAFSHVCPKSSKAGTPVFNRDWDAKKFVPDEKASAAASRMYELYGMNVERVKPVDTDFKVHIRLGMQGNQLLFCNSCKAAITLLPTAVIGHSHRHEEMSLSLVEPTAMLKVLLPPVEAGVTARLLGLDKKVKRFIEEKNFGCRHCLQERVDNPGEGQDVCSIDMQAMERWRAGAMTFNGIRSHLKERHGVQKVRDEDFWCLEKIKWDEKKSQNLLDLF